NARRRGALPELSYVPGWTKERTRRASLRAGVFLSSAWSSAHRWSARTILRSLEPRYATSLGLRLGRRLGLDYALDRFLLLLAERVTSHSRGLALRDRRGLVGHGPRR